MVELCADFGSSLVCKIVGGSAFYIVLAFNSQGPKISVVK